MSKEQIIYEALSLQPTAISYHLSQHLATLFPDRALLEGDEELFNIEEFAATGQCDVKHKAIVHNQIFTHWHDPDLGTRYWWRKTPKLSEAEVEHQVYDRSKNAWLEVVWDGSVFDVIVMSWTTVYQSFHHYCVLAESMERAKALFVEVCKWNAEIRDEVLVFDGGCWAKDTRLFQAIKGSTFDNLILHGSLKQDIREDFEQFFAARDTYEAYNIPWKRGILLVGPPGNGKTHAVKAIINATKQPCLYIKSFKVPHAPDDLGVLKVFERARKAVPCILVLEDLDSLLTSENRSFFLNELDGFASNAGLVTLATTNHAEKLDPAILDRPSRFDRKYPFELPEQPERLAYIAMWNTKVQEILRISDATVSKLSEATKGFSFAYLKELFLSSTVRWITRPQQGSMDQMLTSQIDVLREQMTSATTKAAEAESKTKAESK